MTAEELAPLQLGAMRTTSLLNALLHLHRARLSVSAGVRTYQLCR